MPKSFKDRLAALEALEGGALDTLGPEWRMALAAHPREVADAAGFMAGFRAVRVALLAGAVTIEVDDYREPPRRYVSVNWERPDVGGDLCYKLHDWASWLVFYAHGQRNDGQPATADDYATWIDAYGALLAGALVTQERQRHG